MNKRIFVGNLSYSTTEDSLATHFGSKEYRVRRAQIVLDRETGRSRGFGFVDFDEGTDVAAVVAAFDDSELDGRRVSVKEAHERPPRTGGGGSGPGGGRFSEPRDRAPRGDRGGRPPVEHRPPSRESRPPRESHAPSFPPAEPPAEGEAQRERRRRHKERPRDEDRGPRRSESGTERRRPKNKWRGGFGWDAGDEDEDD